MYNGYRFYRQFLLEDYCSPSHSGKQKREFLRTLDSRRWVDQVSAESSLYGFSRSIAVVSRPPQPLPPSPPRSVFGGMTFCIISVARLRNNLVIMYLQNRYYYCCCCCCYCRSMIYPVPGIRVFLYFFCVLVWNMRCTYVRRRSQKKLHSNPNTAMRDLQSTHCAEYLMLTPPQSCR